MRSEKDFSDSRGEYRCIRDHIKGMEHAISMAWDILEIERPEGYHPWTVRCQKTDRGKRCSVEVIFRRTVW